MCSSMGKVLSGIPQSFLDRVQANNPDADMNAIATAWRKRYAESEAKLSNADELKVGDKIDPNRYTIGDDANLQKADAHAYWNIKKPDNTSSKDALEAASDLTITNIEKRKDGVKVTATWEIGKDYRLKNKDDVKTVTRVFKNDDRVRRK